MLYTGIYPLFPEWCRRQAGSWICPGTVLFSLFSSRSFCIYSRAWASVFVTFTFVHVFFECIDEFFDRKMIQHVGACHRGDCNTIRLQNNKVAKLRDSEGLRLWKSEIHAVEQWIAVRDKGEIERKFDLFFCQLVAITKQQGLRNRDVILQYGSRQDYPGARNIWYNFSKKSAYADSCHIKKNRHSREVCSDRYLRFLWRFLREWFVKLNINGILSAFQARIQSLNGFLGFQLVFGRCLTKKKNCTLGII